MPLTPQPTVTASPYTIVNPFGQWAAVSVTGGTVSNITVNGVTVASATGVNFTVPPGATVVITYSSLPAVAWSNPSQGPGYAPGYAAENTGLINLEGNLPWTAHAEASQTGLGIAVSN